jgi:hypothetical protein
MRRIETESSCPDIVLLVLGFILLLWISRRFAKPLRAGDLFLLYLICYPGVRFWLEFYRTDSWFLPGTHINAVHILCAIAIVTAITPLIIRHRTAPRAALVGGSGAAPDLEESSAPAVAAAGDTGASPAREGGRKGGNPSSQKRQHDGRPHKKDRKQGTIPGCPQPGKVDMGAVGKIQEREQRQHPAKDKGAGVSQAEGLKVVFNASNTPAEHMPNQGYHDARDQEKQQVVRVGVHAGGGAW